MSEHVVGRVTGTRVCLRCSDLSASGAWECQPNDQCPCCLLAEVEALKTSEQDMRDRHEMLIKGRDDLIDALRDDNAASAWLRDLTDGAE